jgi:division/cell wall cluster transcriptional repressor MraZ
LHFGGTEQCRLDANGRLKLSPKAIACFKAFGGLELVLHYWPEGCLALLPKSTWERMYYEQGYASSSNLDSVAGRQRQRLFTRFTHSTEISAQGRVSIPSALRERAALQCGELVLLAGYGESLEVWQPQRFELLNAELDRLEAMQLEAKQESQDLP